jgi:ABC-2 type transport system ATP-binding protein
MIEVEDLTKYYGGKRAISGLTFRIEKGEIVGFLGLNGAGKTTTLRILSCLILPSSGRIRIDGLDGATHAHEIRSRLGFLPDTPPLYDEMTVRDYLRFVAELKGVAAKDVPRRVGEALETCNLTKTADQLIGTLSHGYRQRAGLAQALVHRPSLLILDEPTGGLDPVQIVEMRQLIKRLGGEHTVLLSSHNLSEISHTCDRLLVIHEGRVAANGTEEEISQTAGGGSRVIEVTVEGSGQVGERAAQLLGKLPGILTARVKHSGDGQADLEVESTEDRRAAIAKAVIDAGLGLLRMDRRAVELESIFQRLVAPGTGGRRAA